MNLQLDNYITLDAATIAEPNLTDRFSESDLYKIGSWVADCYNRDRDSRELWEKRTNGALELAMQVQKEKTFPWPDCSHIS